MTQAERRHDRLAVRLSLIISRLVAGETLNMTRLAAEFGVSVRTLRRDFRERLMYLDLEYRRGQCRLRSTGGGVQGELDALTFAHRAGLADIFPGLDRRLAGMLLTAGGMPCLRHSLCHRPAHWCSTVLSVPLPPASGFCYWPRESAVTGWPRTA
ncbi:transcriptional regulator [Klebsiella oxytoca]|nr:transcriptional regulator [Klebsiella oxytoca]